MYAIVREVIQLKMNLNPNYLLFSTFNIKTSSFSNDSKKPSNFILEDRDLSQLKRYFDRLKEAEAKNKKKGISGKITLSSSLRELAKATTPSQVYNVIKIAQGKVTLMKSLGATDLQIASARRVIKKLQAKAELKIGSLKTEQRIREQRQLEANAKHREEVQKLTKELRQKRKARKARERGDVLTAIEEESKKNNSSSNQSIANGITEAIPIAETSEVISVAPTADGSAPVSAEGQNIDISL